VFERCFSFQRGVVFLVATAVALYHFKKELFLRKGTGMRKAQALLFGFLVGLFAPHWVMAQAMGEYGRSVQGATERQRGARAQDTVNGSRNPKGKNDVPGVGDLGGKPVASQLVVAANEAGLYPRQDDESEKMDRLSRGEILIPILQSNGGNEWFMVKTSGGKVGWVKATDVRAEPGKKP
jgi:hypothetical protein